MHSLFSFTIITKYNVIVINYNDHISQYSATCKHENTLESMENKFWSLSVRLLCTFDAFGLQNYS